MSQATRTASFTRDFVERSPVFTAGEFRAALPPTAGPSAAWDGLNHAREKGWVESVTRGLYVSRLGVFRDPAPDPLLIASRLAPDALVAYHSALDAHGVSHSVFTRFTVLSRSAPRKYRYGPFEFRRLQVTRRLASLHEAGRFVTEARRYDEFVRVTSRARTLVDCLWHPELSGGLEEVLRSVGGFTSIDVREVAEYLGAVGSPTVAARVGWALSAAPELWHVDRTALEALRRTLGAGPYYVERGRGPMRFIKEWRLYVSDDADLELWLRE